MRKVVRAVFLSMIVMSTGACVDSGLPGKNLPLEEARHKQPRYPMYSEAPEMATDFASIQLADNTWLIRPIAPQSLGLQMAYAKSNTLMRPDANMNGVGFYTLTWDSAPYDRVFASVDGRNFAVYERVQ